MNREEYDFYLGILKKELVPALGCTEPIAIAFASAKAREILGEFPKSMQVLCSGNIIKNVKGVTVPNSGGLVGISAAAILGAVGGDSSRELEVLSTVTQEDINQTKNLLRTDFCSCRLQENVDNLYVDVLVSSDEHSAEVVVSGRHTQIVRMTVDGKQIFAMDETASEDETNSTPISIRKILAFAESVKTEDLDDTIGLQIKYNRAISDYGLANDIGAKVGKTILETNPNDVHARAKASAAAGSDARMAGCSLPVVIISGSGNQGITASMPVLEYAEMLGCSGETTTRALVISNLVAYHIKHQIGSLSAFCGAVTAACGAGAAITYLYHGSYEQICNTVINTLMGISGMVCDGAKASCALKIATAIDNAITAHEMSMRGICFKSGEGLRQEDVESTLKSVAYVAREGMSGTDTVILKIMTGEIVP